VGVAFFEQVDVLIDGVCSTPVPCIARPHLRRDKAYEVSEGRRHAPARHDVLVERLGFELRQDIDLIKPGIDEVV